MDYCTYHPLEAATYHCPQCRIAVCDTCVDDSENDLGVRCLKCRGELTLLAAEHRVPPFWRRLEDSFRYPINLQTLLLIAVVSVVTPLTALVGAGFLPSLIVNLAATGVMLKYSFLCLQETSAGKFTAPNLADAYLGGISLLLKLLAMLLLMGGAVLATAVFIHPGLANLLGVLLIIAFPATLIHFAISGDFAAALNPVNTTRLILTLGLPYGVLIALILVMVGSVSVIHQLIGFDFSLVTLSLQGMVSNYYLVVVFHIMGYMLFQYQGRLGYRAREHSDEEGRSREAVTLVYLDVLLKEGNYDALLTGFDKALEQFPTSKALFARYFDFLIQAKNPAWLGCFSERYLQFLHHYGQGDMLYQAYRSILTITPGFRPDSPDLRLVLARACQHKGDARGVVHLINGMQRLYPDYPQLPTALELLAEALDLLPGMSEKASACRALVERVRHAHQQANAADAEQSDLSKQ